MDVQKKLDEIVATLEGARSMPMSASCVVNRAELLRMLDEVRAALPDSLAQAQQLLGGREQLVEEAHREAEQIVEQARAERGSLIADTEVARGARAEADRMLDEARREAEQIRVEADDYVDSKLANFEVVLSKTIGSVDRGRDKLLGRDPGYDPDFDHPEGGAPDAPERSADPQEQRRRADDYVDAQFRAFGAALVKTLEAVGRGREKLAGARPSDQLGEQFAGPDGRQPGVPRPESDESFLADLAEIQPPPAAPQPVAQPAPEPVAQPVPQLAQPVEPQGQPVPVAVAPAYYDSAYQQGYDHAGYQQYDGYQQQGYEQPAAGYGWPVQHDPQQQPQPQDPQYQQQPYDPQQPGYPQSPPALDETSLFDTAMIDLEQLRQYDDQGR